jgi:hypothetical protein
VIFLSIFKDSNVNRSIMKTYFWLSAILFNFVTVLNAQIIHVPADYSTIQEAINSSLNGDTIVVSPGTYYENINFRGKNIVLTSMFYIDRDTSFISSTIINGSQPQQPDSASCVIISSGEDSTAILQGFTLTGGTGTKWTDIHNLSKYREGGGILIELSSPVIQYNIIEYNAATDVTGVVSAGGGGMRIGDSNPKILNNIIAYNQGLYGPGVVLNYTGVTIRNNIIAYNIGATQYNGGAGIWSYGIHGTDQRIIENNTIVANESMTGTGGVLAWSCSLVLKNNIIRDNLPLTTQIKILSGTADVTYCDVLNGYAGSGNIDEDPDFQSDRFLLTGTSPCIDKGDSTVFYNDSEDPANPGYAEFPSRGTVRNDIGVYGGPGSFVTGNIPSSFPTGIAITEDEDVLLSQNHPNPASDLTTIDYFLPISTDVTFTFFDMTGRVILTQSEKQKEAGKHHFTIDVRSLHGGLYFFSLSTARKSMTRKMIVQ